MSKRRSLLDPPTGSPHEPSVPGDPVETPEPPAIIGELPGPRIPSGSLDEVPVFIADVPNDWAGEDSIIDFGDDFTGDVTPAADRQMADSAKPAVPDPQVAEPPQPPVPTSLGVKMPLQLTPHVVSHLIVLAILLVMLISILSFGAGLMAGG